MVVFYGCTSCPREAHCPEKQDANVLSKRYSSSTQVEISPGACAMWVTGQTGPIRERETHTRARMLTRFSDVQWAIGACRAASTPDDSDGVIHHEELSKVFPLARPYQSYTVQRSRTCCLT